MLPLLLAGGSILSSLAGARAAQSGLRSAQDRLSHIPVPKAADLQPHFTRPGVVGTYDPHQDIATEQDPSALGAYAGDPQVRQAQLQALADLGRVGAGGGLAAEDRASLYGAERDIATQERGQREALAGAARRRGVGNSGLDLVQQQIAQQSAADRAAQTAVDVAGQASQRRQSALAAAGQLGGAIRGQDFGEASNKAAAQDAINRFNASNLAGVRAANVAAVNDAALRNLSEKQRVADAGTNLSNAEEDARVKIPLQRYSLLAGRAGQLGQFDQAQGQQQQQMFGGISAALNAFNPGFGGVAGAAARPPTDPTNPYARYGGY